jgi:hypothetical protein
MSRKRTIATCATAIIVVAAVAIAAPGALLKKPDVSAAADMQTRPATVQMAQFNPCPNGKCKF